MTKFAIVFPGQGSQFIGMGKSLCEAYPVAKQTYEEANEAIGFDLTRIIFEGPAETLDRTEHTQPALLTASIAALRVYIERNGAVPDFYAGHSLGEYTALVAGGALKFKDAVRIVHLRGKFMQEAVPAGVGKMCAIIGLDIPDVTAVCEAASTPDEVVVPANINSPGQIVISGHAGAVDRAAVLAKERGAKRALPLQVSAPSHSPLMSPAADRLAIELAKIEWAMLSVPVVSNVEAEPMKGASSISGLLVRQLTSPVRWVDIIKRMKADGVTRIMETGPGKALTGLIKRIEPDILTVNLGEAADVDKAVEAARGS
ncbi:MAG: [acyl-carrier-protein] S-malonyltransferase [Deltaproteobacteria bacterium RIFCSPLOWO2_02_FULL_53_8]|nr:MAG: [acyl-carrier-protein] S-malonyltransferase [Deltaproteobacteria bacterium RIFCSPLOWO2_02_FULL_53_8]